MSPGEKPSACRNCPMKWPRWGGWPVNLTISKAGEVDPDELVPLAEFIGDLKRFWTEAGIKETFNPEFKDGQPINAASKLVVGAASRLGQRYTPANCESAWRPRRGKAADPSSPSRASASRNPRKFALK